MFESAPALAQYPGDSEPHLVLSGLQAMPLPALELDGEGYVVAANAAAEKFLRLPQPLTGKLRYPKPLQKGVSHPGKIRIEGEGLAPMPVDWVTLSPITGHNDGHWLAILVPDQTGREPDAQEKRFGETLTLSVAARLFDPIRLAGRFAEKLPAFENSEDADTFSRLKKNLDLAETKVRWLKDYLAITSRPYPFEVLDFKKIIDSALSAGAGRETPIRLMAQPLPPLMAMGNEYLIRTLIDEIFRFLRSHASVRKPILASRILTQKATDARFTWVLQCHGVAFSSVSPQELFRAFHSLDLDLSTSELGLFLAKQIMELHDGKMRVESGEGQNVTISLKFPRLPL